MIIIDISVPLHEKMPVWPGSKQFHLEQTMSIRKGDSANVSALSCDLHSGTHVDAPLHFCDEGRSVDRLSLETLCGSAMVVDCSGRGMISAKILTSLILTDGVERLLIKSGNSMLWEKQSFDPDFVALTEDGAEWLVGNGIRLVGIDYLSVQPYRDVVPRVHQILLHAGVVVLEGLNLSKVHSGMYELLCLPLNILGAEGAPARAILRTLQGEECRA